MTTMWCNLTFVLNLFPAYAAWRRLINKQGVLILVISWSITSEKTETSLSGSRNSDVHDLVKTKQLISLISFPREEKDRLCTKKMMDSNGDLLENFPPCSEAQIQNVLFETRRKKKFSATGYVSGSTSQMTGDLRIHIYTIYAAVVFLWCTGEMCTWPVSLMTWTCQENNNLLANTTIYFSDGQRESWSGLLSKSWRFNKASNLWLTLFYFSNKPVSSWPEVSATLDYTLGLKLMIW